MKAIQRPLAKAGAYLPGMRVTRQSFGLWLVAACFALPGLGCGSSHEQEVAKVRGTVFLDGKAVPGGSLMSMPGGGRGAVGSIDANGQFILTTYHPGDGAIVGRHKVAVFPAMPAGESDQVPQNYVDIPIDYRSPHTSGIEVDVKPGEDNVFEIKLVTK